MALLEQMSLEAALAAKEAGQDLAERNADLFWRERVDRAIQELAESGRVFNADDIRLIVGDPPFGYSANSVGAAVSKAAGAGLIVRVGLSTSRRPVGHANLLRTWRGRP